MARKRAGWAAPVPKGPAAPPAPAPSPSRSLADLVAIVERSPSVDGLAQVLGELDRWELDVVERLRASGASWRELGHAYGVTTPQGARLRVLRLRERVKPSTDV